jgi:hypothetical protein
MDRRSGGSESAVPLSSRSRWTREYELTGSSKGSERGPDSRERYGVCAAERLEGSKIARAWLRPTRKQDADSSFLCRPFSSGHRDCCRLGLSALDTSTTAVAV